MEKRLLVINPNTSEEMTQSIENTIYSSNPIFYTNVVHPNNGPKSLESYYDYQIAAFEMINMLQNSSVKYEGVLVSCFGDPGLYALKEMYENPVIGIAEAAMSAAILIGRKFSIIAASMKAVSMMKDLVCQYGLTDRLASVRALNTNVLDIEKNKIGMIDQMVPVIHQCIENGADSIILGCASMTGLKEKLEEKVKIPVIDPIQIGYKWLEALVQADVKVSNKGSFSFPPNGLLKID